MTVSEREKCKDGSNMRWIRPLCFVVFAANAIFLVAAFRNTARGNVYLFILLYLVLSALLAAGFVAESIRSTKLRSSFRLLSAIPGVIVLAYSLTLDGIGNVTCGVLFFRVFFGVLLLSPFFVSMCGVSLRVSRVARIFILPSVVYGYLMLLIDYRSMCKSGDEIFDKIPSKPQALPCCNGNSHGCGAVDLVSIVNAATSRLSAPPSPSQSPVRPIFRIAELPKVATKPIASSGDILADVRVGPAADAPERASELNQAMDALLDLPEIPADYGETMVSIFRDRSRNALERGFAVQHIGLYAAALNRRGVYDPAESSSLRAALWDASCERDSGVGAAALRALADMAAFDPGVGAARLDAVIASCAADASCATPVRVMAIQLSGERRIASARQAIAAIAADPASPEMLRRPARYALAVLDGKEVAQ